MSNIVQNFLRRIEKIYGGRPTIPPVGTNHVDDSWLVSDIYAGEFSVDLNTGKIYSSDQYSVLTLGSEKSIESGLVLEKPTSGTNKIAVSSGLAVINGRNYYHTSSGTDLTIPSQSDLLYTLAFIYGTPTDGAYTGEDGSFVLGLDYLYVTGPNYGTDSVLSKALDGEISIASDSVLLGAVLISPGYSGSELFPISVMNYFNDGAIGRLSITDFIKYRISSTATYQTQTLYFAGQMLSDFSTSEIYVCTRTFISSTRTYDLGHHNMYSVSGGSVVFDFYPNAGIQFYPDTLELMTVYNTSRDDSDEVVNYVGGIAPGTTAGALKGMSLVDLVDEMLFGEDGDNFKTDLTVSLSGSKTFGRYENGDIIYATGKSARDVIMMAIVEPINPTITLTSSSTVYFNQTTISNVLNFSYVINSLGATVSSAILEWRRNNSGTWTTLSTSTTTPSSYTHSMTDTNFNTQPFNYRYTVIDSAGGESIAYKNITPSSYVAPSISISVVGTSVTSPETNSKREKGNISSTISGTITRNSTYVNLSTYQLQYSKNGGTWTNFGSAVSIGPGTSSISSTLHNDSALYNSTSISYRAVVTDAYTSTNGSSSTVTFLNLIFYSPVSSVPTDSSGVRAISTRIFTDGVNGSSWLLYTGTTYTSFTIAMPSTYTLSQVLGLDALNANITSNYILNTFTVNDFYGTAVTYKIYTMTNAIPYTSSHRHQITRS